MGILVGLFLDTVFFPRVFVLHAFRCGHCKKLAPEYEKAAKALAEAGASARLAKVNSADFQVLTCAFLRIGRWM